MTAEEKVLGGMPLPKFILLLLLSGIGGLLSVGALGSIISPERMSGLF
jgi:hypothetical protein